MDGSAAPKTQLYPCQTDDPELWFIEKPASRVREIAEIEQRCLQCPLAQQVRCAKQAVEDGDIHGTWAGVTLPGTTPTRKNQLDEARERLRLIAGIDRCQRAGCGRWFKTVEHTPDTMRDARTMPLSLPYEATRVCPRCLAEDARQARRHDKAQRAEQRDATAASALTDGDDDSDLALYWSIRKRQRRNPTTVTSRTEWLLITPEGVIEGRYAWHTAVRNFGRSHKRFIGMLNEGWELRVATAADRDWNQRPSGDGPQPVPVTAMPTAPQIAATKSLGGQSFQLAAPIPA